MNRIAFSYINSLQKEKPLENSIDNITSVISNNAMGVRIIALINKLECSDLFAYVNRDIRTNRPQISYQSFRKCSSIIKKGTELFIVHRPSEIWYNFKHVYVDLEKGLKVFMDLTEEGKKNGKEM